MHPAARLSAIIEMIDSLLPEWARGRQIPADLTFQRYTKARRFIGAKDRRALADDYYCLWRGFGLAQWAAQAAGQTPDGRALLLAHLARLDRLETESGAYGQVPHAPEPLSDTERQWLAAIDWPAAPPAARANMPAWLHAKFVERFGAETEAELAAFNQPAPFTLRTNTLQTDQASLLAELHSLGHDAMPARFSPHAIHLAGRVAAGNLAALVEGRAEIQDESSQLAVLAAAARPGMRVIDWCAGGGGKSLALAAVMQNEGRILALDINARRLSELPPRAERAGATIIEPHLLAGPDAPLPRGWQQADIVLIDAPCTGLGTLRRNPDAAWRTTPAQLQELQQLQSALLQRAISALKPGGRLLYATCSVLEEENQALINPLLDGNFTLSVVPAEKLWDKASPLREDPLRAQDSHGRNGPGMTLTPLRHGTDGFTFAALHKKEG